MAIPQKGRPQGQIGMWGGSPEFEVKGFGVLAAGAKRITWLGQSASEDEPTAAEVGVVWFFVANPISFRMRSTFQMPGGS